MRYDLTGQRFGRLTVVACVGTDGHGNAVWECKCDCGNVTSVRSQNLRNGATRSCGCARGMPKPAFLNCPPRTDCVSCKKSKGYNLYFCKALTEMLCASRGECKFYKHKE